MFETGSFGVKTRSPGLFSGKSVEAIIMNLAQNVY